MSDYCIVCGERSPQEGDSGRYIELVDTENLSIYTETWVCVSCYWQSKPENDLWKR